MHMKYYERNESKLHVEQIQVQGKLKELIYTTNLTHTHL